MHPRKLATRACRTSALTATAIAVAAGAAAPAFAALGPAGRPRPLAVSVPAEAAPLGPGSTGRIPLRLVNPGTAPVTVQVTGRQVVFGDDGRVTIAGPDPQWEHRVDFPSEPLTVAARSYRDVPVTVRMPARISPDLYFVGFLVTPLPNAGGNLTYVNQVGSYLTIDVPGPRSRALAADLHLPAFSLTSHSVRGTLEVRNVGRAAANYWVENDTTATPGSSDPRQERRDRSLLPTGRSRAIVVEAEPSFPIALATIRVHVFYPGRTDAATREIVLTKRVLVVKPLALAALGGILLVGGVWYGRRRRRRRRRRRPRPGAVPVAAA
jgi:hypothetical protein